eukprot:scaffold616_cov306-Pavlova_lutheri.AAC.18
MSTCDARTLETSDTTFSALKLQLGEERFPGKLGGTRMFDSRLRCSVQRNAQATGWNHIFSPVGQWAQCERSTGHRLLRSVEI